MGSEIKNNNDILYHDFLRKSRAFRDFLVKVYVFGKIAPEYACKPCVLVYFVV
jgi:hypothetical protein